MVACVVAATSGRPREAARATAATLVHIVRAFALSFSRATSSPRPKRDRTRLPPTTAGSPTPWGALLPKRISREMPRTGTATAQTATAARTAPATPRARDQPRPMVVGKILCIVVALMRWLLLV